jgi:hypothetical protein
MPVIDANVRDTPATTRRLLYVAAAFNLAAVPIIVVGARYAPALLGLDPTSARQRLYVDLFAWLIACFGFAYGLAARDLPRFWPLVALGALAKAGVVVLAFAYFLTGHASVLVALLATGDAVFTGAFVQALRRSELVNRRRGVAP